MEHHIFTYLIFILGFVVLITGANMLIDGSASIARKLSISNIAIGLTVVAFGTSAPEFIVSFFATLKGNTDLAIGNILGSNIANILLVLGISAIIFPIAVQRNTVLKEIPFSLLAVLLLGITANDILFDREATSVITRIDGLVFLLFLVIFITYTFTISKLKENGEDSNEVKSYGYLKSATFILIGLICLVLGGKWIVDGAVGIAELFNVSQSLIGLTVIAVGTSLPELATSAVAAFKKQTDIAIGNIVGSNVLNILWILGFNALIRPLPLNPASNIDILMTIFASLLLFVSMYVSKKHVIERWQGIVMVVIYFTYVGFLIISR
ncbi:MAG: calcium/sodium antiporter [Bacteroidales bacterium]|nr:calcium/sodium antiporter [Bacteroidales bacterium]